MNAPTEAEDKAYNQGIQSHVEETRTYTLRIALALSDWVVGKLRRSVGRKIGQIRTLEYGDHEDFSRAFGRVVRPINLSTTMR